MNLKTIIAKLLATRKLKRAIKRTFQMREKCIRARSVEDNIVSQIWKISGRYEVERLSAEQRAEYDRAMANRNFFLKRHDELERLEKSLQLRLVLLDRSPEAPSEDRG